MLAPIKLTEHGMESMNSIATDDGATPRTVDTGAASAIFLLQKLAVIAKFRDVETTAHMFRVGQIAGLLAWHHTRDSLYARLVCRAAPFHDIGKICIPDSILMKPGLLSGAEWEMMKKHPVMGGKLLHCPGSPLLTVAEEIALGHHEKFDGSGYPSGQVADRIPLSARIAAIADYYDALASDRVYRSAWQRERVLASIRSLSGQAFDPQLVEVVFRRHDDIVQVCELTNQRWAQADQGPFKWSDFEPLIAYED